MAKKKKSKTNNNHIEKPTVLIILDGFGLANPKDEGNAITPDSAPNIFRYMKNYPNSTLTTYGESAGLFSGQPGNSEAGHLNIGAGRVVKQDLVIISEAIRNGTFFKNHAFKQALFHVKKYDTAVHVMGLLTDRASAHAYSEHMYALLEFFRRNNHKKIYLHLFTDGRDSSPHGAANFLHELRGHLYGTEEIATIMGRYYAMDRNNMWDRTKKAYEAMVLGKGDRVSSAEVAIGQAYNRGETDEFITPAVIEDNGRPIATIKDNDAVYFINARSDRARQITKAFVTKNLKKEEPKSFRRTKIPKNIRFVAMTDFGQDLENVFTAFPSPDVENSIVEVIGEKRKQIYISETEKYAHVTYFINGGYMDPVNGEDRKLVPSLQVKSYSEKPHMSAKRITDEILKCITKKTHDFICVNYPNADMVGHSGNTAVTKKAIKFMDMQIKRVVDETLKKDGQILIVADHGNADQMMNILTRETMTEHSLNPVPCIMIKKNAKGAKLKNGILADVAPTLLKMMDISAPKEMTGKALY